MNDVKIIYCYATYDGGGILLSENKKTMINNAFISNCRVRTILDPSCSGGISISNDQDLILKNSIIAYCHSTDGGGKNTCYDIYIDKH